MKTHVEFTSTKFPSYGSDVEGINHAAGIYGKRLAQYLQAQLIARGQPVRALIDEDWGWLVELEHDGDYLLFIGCNSYNEEGGDNHFLCFIEPCKPVIRRWLFKTIDVRDTVMRISALLEDILQADPDIREIAWWDETASGQG